LVPRHAFCAIKMIKMQGGIFAAVSDSATLSRRSRVDGEAKRQSEPLLAVPPLAGLREAHQANLALHRSRNGF
jgi:hypothetical protein